MDEKTKQFLLFIISIHDRVTVTSLLKLAYLCDLVNYKVSKSQISQLHYIRYNYGPYDESIYNYIGFLEGNDMICGKSNVTSDGVEYIQYSLNSDDFKTNLITVKEKTLIKKFLGEVHGLGAGTLTDIAYKTKPMRELGATLGGNENMRVPLDFSVIHAN